ncbi:hypothetical protein DPSP01_000436 [Paraphaeosphaeria sporulosa]
MAAFLNCPTELVDSILEQVLFRDLAALSLASKKLHEFATPQLYSDIDLSIHQGNPRPIINLTRSIFNNPELAKHVKSVRLRDGDEKIQKLYRGYSYDESVPKVSPPRPTDEDGMPEFIEFIKNTGLSYAHLWIDKLRIADFNAFVALLLSRLPALKSFRVGYAAVVPYIERSGQRNPPNIAGENQFHDLSKRCNPFGMLSRTSPLVLSSMTCLGGGIEPGMMKALGTLHGLEGFANIKRFQAPLGILLPDWNWNVGIDPARRLEDSLPCNVEVVTVTDAFMSDYYAYDEYEELDFVRAWLLETASTRTPRLKEVCYYLDRNASEFEEKSCEPIKQIFEGTNVRYRIIKARDEKPWEAV